MEGGEGEGKINRDNAMQESNGKELSRISGMESMSVTFLLRE